MGYYALDGFDFGDVFDSDTLKDVAIAGGVGLATAMLGGRALSYVGEMLPIDDPATKDYVASGIGIAIGLLGAAMLHQYSKPASYALAGVLIGEGASRIVRKAANMDPQWQLNGSRGGMRGLNATTVELMQRLASGGQSRLNSGMGTPMVTVASRANGLTLAGVPQGAPQRYAPYM